MGTLDRILYFLLAALVAVLPFEFQSFPILSSLQWLFAAIGIVALPLMIRERTRLLGDRLVQAALVFVCTVWIAALVSPEFTWNAIKAAIRTTAGFTLLCATLCVRDRERLLNVWSVAAIAAAVYGIIDYAGFGIPGVFHSIDFYVGSAVRLTGSFEYPNTTAAYFALSLPIAWIAARSAWMRVAGSLVICVALALTYSRGATLAVVLMLAVWALAGRQKLALQASILVGGVLAALLLFHPSVSRRFLDAQPFNKAFSAEYTPEFNLLRQRPNETGSMIVRIRNTGKQTWAADGEFSMMSRWYDTKEKKLAEQSTNDVPIPTPLPPQEIVSVRAPFKTPAEPGLYLLTWDIFGKQSGWLSAQGVYPALVEVHVQADGEVSAGHADMSRWLDRDMSRLFVVNDPLSRVELWTAALGMARDRPLLGVGPDNFRLLYGRQFGLILWDTRIRSNNLYLELLAGSGLIGLAAFVVMMSTLRWNTTAASIALGVFLTHGLVDVFLMTTPIYFAFWILLGEAKNTRS